MKYHIEKNTVQETLVIPIYGRKVCTEIYPDLYRDDTAQKLIEQIDYDFSLLEEQAKKSMYRFGFLEVAMRQNDLAYEIKDYLKTHPNAAVVNLGCGLDDTGRKCDNGTCKIYNLDFADVINVRNELLPAGEREENVACDINDTSWFKKNRRFKRRGFLCFGCVLLLFDGTGKRACPKNGGSVSERKTCVRCGKQKSGKITSQNMA